MLTIRVPLAVRKQRGGQKLVLKPGNTMHRGPSGSNSTLAKALARTLR